MANTRRNQRCVTASRGNRTSSECYCFGIGRIGFIGDITEGRMPSERRWCYTKYTIIAGSHSVSGLAFGGGGHAPAVTGSSSRCFITGSRSGDLGVGDANANTRHSRERWRCIHTLPKGHRPHHIEIFEGVNPLRLE